MLRVLLLLLVVAGLHARPLHRFPNAKVKHIGPQMVQNDHRHNSVLKHLNADLNPKKQVPVPVEIRRQGTEPSRRFLMDLNTGMLKEELSEMNRRVSGFYNPQPDEMRKGTQNSHATLVDPRTGQPLGSQTELQRSTGPLDEFRQGTEYQPHVLQELRLKMMHKQGSEPSGNLLMDLNAGLLKEHRNEMHIRAGSKWEVVSDYEDVRSQDSSEHEKNHKAAPDEIHRQGTEPSRRVLIDMDTGMPKEELSEMNRRDSGFYNPPAYEMRKGTQNSHATLVDPRTGQPLASLTELQRSTGPLDEFRQGTEYQPHVLQELRLNMMHKQGTEPSRNLLMDLNSGLLKEHQNNMDRREGSKWEVVSEHADVRSQDSSEHKENHKAAPVEIRRQGTEASRRVLIDMDTGMPKEELSEMNRRVSGYYNPPAYEMRKGTQNSHATLVDPRTGQPLASLTELQRSTGPLDEFRQGTEYQPHILQELRLNMMHKQGTEPPRNLLIYLNAGLLKEHQNKMDRKQSSKLEVVAEHEGEKSEDTSEHKENHKAAPVEIRRQGTEASHRLLIDTDTGMPKEELSEMNRRVSGFYNPQPYEMRKGTQNSHATLVDPRTGQPLASLTELQRSTGPLDEFRQGTEYQPHTLQKLRIQSIMKHAVQPLQRL
ncbi:uncharacterized protein [Garra rufa]|uniref:uncharacterized protein n=1 Tax=Garra rufa TaxID=137080 RepID=UPI003CCE7178